MMLKILNSAIFGWLIAIITFSITAKVSHEIAVTIVETGQNLIGG